MNNTLATLATRPAENTPAADTFTLFDDGSLIVRSKHGGREYSLSRLDDGLACTCPAARFGNPCRHCREAETFRRNTALWHGWLSLFGDWQEGGHGADFPPVRDCALCGGPVHLRLIWTDCRVTGRSRGVMVYETCLACGDWGRGR